MAKFWSFRSQFDPFKIIPYRTHDAVYAHTLPSKQEFSSYRNFHVLVYEYFYLVYALKNCIIKGKTTVKDRKNRNLLFYCLLPFESFKNGPLKY